MFGLIVSLGLLSLIGGSRAGIDPDKAAELSREIREHFRSSGANWVSPKMFNDLELERNQKPIMFVFTSRSCADCREFMRSWMDLDKTTVSSITAQFLSVLVLDDYIFEMGQYSPGTADYLPRVLFADPDGTLQLGLKAPDADKESPYYYDTADQVVDVMRTALMQHWEGLGTDVFPGDLEDDM